MVAGTVSEGAANASIRQGRSSREKHAADLLKIKLLRAGHPSMTYVVTETCIRCKYTDCVDVCRWTAFARAEFSRHRPGRMHRLHALRRRCPVEAIYAEDDVPPDQQNSPRSMPELAKLWPPIIERKPAPADADEWKGAKDKLKYLER